MNDHDHYHIIVRHILTWTTILKCFNPEHFYIEGTLHNVLNTVLFDEPNVLENNCIMEIKMNPRFKYVAWYVAVPSIKKEIIMKISFSLCSIL